MPVDHVTWSDDETYLATADLSGRLNVRIRDPSTSPISVAEYPLSMKQRLGVVHANSSLARTTNT